MKKTKLLGSKLIENINYPRIPNVCIFNNPNDVYDAKFEEGDLLDANSIKQITKNIKPQDIQEFTYVINLDATSKASEFVQHCKSAVENGKDNFVDIAHAYLKFYNNGGGIIGYGQFFGDTSTHGILGNTSYVNAYIFDSYNGRERLDFLIR